MSLLTIPAPIDPHVHLRDLDWAHKATFASETAAALAGGYWAICDMPNTAPTTTTRAALDLKLARLHESARCDYGVYFGADQHGRLDSYSEAAPDTIGIKLYCNATTGTLLLADQESRAAHMRAWAAASRQPIAVHAEGETVAQILALVRQHRAHVHFCHISTADEIDLLRDARRDGLPISIGVCPHHLTLTQDDLPVLGAYGLMKPELKTRADADALWSAVIDGTVDVIESDHAPHTRAEKESDNPPYGVPGLETTLPLLCTAVNEGRITPDRLIELVSTNPARIFRLVPPPDTSTVIDLDSSYVIEDKHLLTAPGWSPFAGMRVSGKVIEVKIRGRIVYDGEQVIAAPGSGINVIDRLAQ
ncbi:MAG: dihydroorotase family protein [Chloroflexota bacterium]|nr:dihydroorotase family protein [Chloroflexota bacterium]